jgi:Raf kinase inhibitor-like YbhB/YbcL family protein
MMQLQSAAFIQESTIPKKHTCDGPDLSPALSWSGAPEGTKAFALVCDDPDAPAGSWVHWVVYDLPATTTSLPEGVPKDRELKGGGRQGVNDFGRIGYGGPCPPRGRSHRYFFRLYAMNGPVDLAPGATRADFMSAARDRIVAEAEILGTYGR